MHRFCELQPGMHEYCNIVSRVIPYNHSMLSIELLQLLKEHTQFYNSHLHGFVHWKAVERNGHYLADINGADKPVITHFSFFHDCMRVNEDDDPEHGPRAAAFIKEHRDLLDLSDDQYKQLHTAVSGHTHGRRSPDITIATCWDADRLDLGRVGISPRSELLLTPEAKRIADEKDLAVLGIHPRAGFKEKFYPREAK